MSCDWRGNFELLPTAKLFETQTATTTNDRDIEPNSQSSRTGRNRWKEKHAKSMPATSATERVAMTRLWNSAKYAAVSKGKSISPATGERPARNEKAESRSGPVAVGYSFVDTDEHPNTKINKRDGVRRDLHRYATFATCTRQLCGTSMVT